MKRQPVTSSNLASVGYDDAAQTLEVEFLDRARSTNTLGCHPRRIQRCWARKASAATSHETSRTTIDTRGFELTARQNVLNAQPLLEMSLMS